MSMYRECPNCFRTENIRLNFEENFEAERKFHHEKWCDCGYNSPEEMMKDQDMGFENPRWLLIAKYFIKNYHLRIRQGRIKSKDELVRFFLKQLQFSAKYYNASLEIASSKFEESTSQFVYGKTATKPKVNIFNSYDDKELDTIIEEAENISTINDAKYILSENKKLKKQIKTGSLLIITEFLIIVILLSLFF